MKIDPTPGAASPAPDTSLRGQEVVVVAESEGLGRAVALAVRRLGAGVTLMLVGGTAALGDAAIDLEAADPERVELAFEGLGHVDHVFSAIGAPLLGAGSGSGPGTFLDERVLANLNLVQAAAPRMPPRGSFTFLASLVGDEARGASLRSSGESPSLHGASPSLAGLARALAIELDPLRVNAVLAPHSDAPSAAAERALAEAVATLMQERGTSGAVRQVGATS